MSTFASILTNDRGNAAFIRCHPLPVYFFLAYAGMWIVISLIPKDIELTGWLNVIVFRLLALSLVVATRGTLSYPSNEMTNG